MHQFHIVPTTCPLHCGLCGQGFMPTVDDCGGMMVAFDELPMCADCAEEICPQLLHKLRDSTGSMRGTMIQSVATPLGDFPFA